MTGQSESETAGNVRQLRPERSPADIVRGLCEGDRAAGAALYRLYGKLINRMVWRLLGADSEHDDVVHQVFVAILGSLPRLRDPSALGPWVGRLTINTVRKALRYRQTRRIVAPNPELLEATAGQDDPERQLWLKRFFAVLDEIAPDERIVLVLRFVEGRTLAEVAVSCGFSLATAKRRLAGAKQSFLALAAADLVLASMLEEEDE